MKKLLLLFPILLAAGMAAAQLPACCAKPTGMLAMLSDKEFLAAHEPPLPLEYLPKAGSTVTFETEDGKKGSAFYIPAREATSKVLLVFHEWWGLNDYIKREAQVWQDSLGPIDIYAVDLYDGKIATTPEEASKLATSLDPTRTDAIIKGVLVTAGRDKQIATLGWCLGGGYAFRASVLAGNQAYGCVMYYGPPEQDGRKIKPLNTDVLYVWGAKDKFITRDKVAGLQTAVKALGKGFQWETYDADHAFANPSNPHHDAAASADAQAKSLKFLRSHLQLD